jgi:hypothetical protein
VLDQQKDIGFAAATAEPWITENGWMLLCARGIAPDAQLVLAYDPPQDAMHKIGVYARAIAEAAVFGGSYAVPSTALRNDGAARARADWRRTIAGVIARKCRPAVRSKITTGQMHCAVAFGITRPNRVAIQFSSVLSEGPIEFAACSTSRAVRRAAMACPLLSPNPPSNYYDGCKAVSRR